MGTARHAQADEKHQQEVDGNDREINRRQGNVLDSYTVPSITARAS
jgi:hypothetical protein